MKIIRNILIALWRVWFYLLVLVAILVFLPFLVLFTSHEKFYNQFFIVARMWATVILYGMGFYPRVKYLQKPEKGKSYIFVANHTSMTDIMLMLCVVKNPFVFVGKKELARFPIFGFFYKKTCILVDRNNAKSRNKVFEQAQRRLSKGTSICIFPEGGVPDDETVLLDHFKDGAFRMAIDHQIPIVPLVFFDNKKRFPFSFFKGSPGKMRVKALPFFITKHYVQKDKRLLREKVRQLFLQELRSRVRT